MGFEKPKNISQYYVFRTVVSLLTAAAAGIMWTLFFLKQPGAHGWGAPLLWAVLFTVLLPLAVYWQQRLYRRHTRKVLFMLDAIENNDTAIHFSETDGTEDNRLVNRSLNRVARILHNVKSETAQREKYYELILDCVNTGIIVLNDNGAVYQKNNEALRLLGLEVFTHVRQLSRVDAHLTDTLTACRPGDKFQAAFGNERGTVNLSVRVSDITVRQEHLRILALNDINNELDAGMSNDDGVALMRERHGDQWADMMRYYLDNFVDSLTGVVPGARVLINDLKAAGVHVWGLSNWQKDLFPVALDHYDILCSLEDRVVSGYVGLRKPHRDIYDYALKQFGIDASGALFVDDKAMNIVGANEAGIRGVRFKDARALRTLLIDAGVAIPAVHEK